MPQKPLSPQSAPRQQSTLVAQGWKSPEQSQTLFWQAPVQQSASLLHCSRADTQLTVHTWATQ